MRNEKTQDSAIIQMPQMLIAGGSSRNVGKTSVCLRLIERYAKLTDIVALKVTRVYPGEEEYHGNHGEMLTGNGFRITEETHGNSLKDTARMLRAGAKRAFYIETTEEALQEAFQAFTLLAGTSSAFVCESRSLRKIVKPGVFVLIRQAGTFTAKKDFNLLEPLADLTAVFDPDAQSSAAIAGRIRWDGYRWMTDPVISGR